MDETLSLIQGKQYKSRKFQKESFTNIANTIANNTTNPNITLSTAKTTSIATSAPIESNQVSTDPDTQEAFDLQTKMEDLLNRLKQAHTDQASFTDKFTNSTDSSKNKYLNNNVHFTSVNKYGYVTNQSELKMYNDANNNAIYNKNKGKHGCPNNEPIEINVSFPLQPKLGQSIELETGIFVVLGLPITKVGESCGFEGRNVYVNKLITNTTATYQGCYKDQPDFRTMTFIGESPPSGISITNGTFYYPDISGLKPPYKYITKNEVWGWTIGEAILINNADDWGVIQPYPGGNQAVILRNRSYLYQSILLVPGTYVLRLWYAKRPDAEANTINIYCTSTPIKNVDTTTEPTIDSIKAEDTVDVWTPRNVNITIETSGHYNIGFYGMLNKDTAITNISIVRNTFVSEGTYTYDMCKQEAINSGNQYFALQDVDKEKKTGYCAVANNRIWPTWFGESKIPESTTAIWSSKTNIDPNIPGSGGKYAKFNMSGSFCVYGSDDAQIYNTPYTPPKNSSGNATPSNYIGCYVDGGDRRMGLQDRGKQKYNYDTCQDLAENVKYFGLQNSSTGLNAQCGLSDDLNKTTSYRKASNCTQLDNGLWSGGGYSNAVYSTDGSGKYYLVLQDDGNMCVYRGKDSNDYQESIWCSMTNKQQQDPNPDRTAAKGKFGRNYITNDEDDQILEVGEFIGSHDGSTFLIMQDDGNLVLYSTKLVLNCPIIDNINYQDIYGGGIEANALYKLDEVAFPANMGKYGYVNGGSRVSEYPTDMITVGYNTITNAYMSGGNGLTSWINGTATDAKTACDANPECGQVITMNQQPTYFLTQSGKYNNNSNSYTSYVKSKTLDTTKINSSCNSQDPIPIDTIQWEHYLKGLPMTPDTKCSITKLESLQNKTIDDLKIQLSDVSSQLVEKLNKIEVKHNSMNTQMDTGGKQIRIDVKKYKENAQKILSYSKMPTKKRSNPQQNNTPANTNTNTLEGYENAYINNIVADSNINSTQGVYSYIIWSVIATVTVIITIELFTNERNTPLWKLVFLSVIIVIMNSLFCEYALLVNILIVIMFVVRKKFKLMSKENNNV
jgi:Asp-tRNA(Asn)/Glu-tRNA(Gln) amidotransferase C subunit